MARQLSLAYLTVNGVSLAEHIAIAAEIGYQSVGLRLLGSPAPAPEDWRNDALMREAAQRLADTGVTVLDCEIFWLRPEDLTVEHSDARVSEPLRRFAHQRVVPPVLWSWRWTAQQSQPHRLIANL